jgi:hypothetical protein
MSRAIRPSIIPIRFTPSCADADLGGDFVRAGPSAGSQRQTAVTIGGCGAERVGFVPADPAPVNNLD